MYALNCCVQAGEFAQETLVAWRPPPVAPAGKAGARAAGCGWCLLPKFLVQPVPEQAPRGRFPAPPEVVNDLAQRLQGGRQLGDDVEGLDGRLHGEIEVRNAPDTFWSSGAEGWMQAFQTTGAGNCSGLRAPDKPNPCHTARRRLTLAGSDGPFAAAPDAVTSADENPLLPVVSRSLGGCYLAGAGGRGFRPGAAASVTAVPPAGDRRERAAAQRCRRPTTT